ncbi:MAG TPA: 2Fe-2S iron-sulfur cluster-binding protein [Spongiibacteraceae bacterium]
MSDSDTSASGSNDGGDRPEHDSTVELLWRRREFLQTSLSGAIAAAVVNSADASEKNSSLKSSSSNQRTFLLRVNGKPHQLTAEPRVTLLDALRERLDLTGTKKGCDRGQCGACTVLINGRRINSCLTLAVMHEDDDIVTIEGLAQNNQLHPLQRAFVEYDALQCGYCTPGQICSGVAAINELRGGAISQATPDVRNATVEITSAEIRERMSGNICRCGAYTNIVAAIEAALNVSSAG